MNLKQTQLLKRTGRLGLVLFWVVFSFNLKAEDNVGNKLAILNTTDKAELGLAQTLQEGLGNIKVMWRIANP